MKSDKEGGVKIITYTLIQKLHRGISVFTFLIAVSHNRSERLTT